MEYTITQQEFQKLRDFVYKNVGISLGENKASMVSGRLSKRLRQLEMSTFEEYYNYISGKDGHEEIGQFINAISTNVTSFFRSPKQWEWLAANINTRLATKKNKKLRIWCAASSSGEEPYTIAIFLKENLRDFGSWDIKILATDISRKALSKAIEGSYEHKDVSSGMPNILLKKYFHTVKAENGNQRFNVVDELKSMIMFRLFNLVTDKFIFKNKFDIIFCRNVMIYFDTPTRKELVTKFSTLLDKGSLLLLGDSEAITTNRDEFALIQTAIYKRN